MRLDDLVNRVFNAAYDEAKKKQHEYFTPEHIMYSALFFEEGKDLLEACGGNVGKVKEELIRFLDENIPIVQEGEPIDTIGIHQIVQVTGRHAVSSGKGVISLGDIFIAIFELKESFASYLIQREGIKRLDILNYITHGIPSYEKSQEDLYDGEEMENEDIDYEVFDTEEKLTAAGMAKLVEKYSVDVTKKAEEGLLDPLIGRADILNRTIQVLSRRLKNNPIHVGDPGVGKTAITEGLATMIVEGRVPARLKGSRIYSLDMGTLLAGTKYRGDFEERVKNILNQLKKNENNIVYIDEIHTVVGAGAVSGGSVDASNILKPFLTEGRLKFIGSTTHEEYKKHFEKDRALSRRFQKIDIPEPSQEECYDILKGLKPYYEKFHHVKYTEGAIRAAVDLSYKHINDRYLPDKAIDVLDETGAFLRMEEDNEEKRISVKEKDIERTISLMAKVPKKTIAMDEMKKLKEIEKNLKAEIFGQDKAIETIGRAIKRSRAGFDEGDKPVASLLFVGPTGVGKTELVKQISNTMGVSLIRFDMSEYQEKHTVARLIGSPPGYVGYEEGGLLTESIRKTPHAVLLLDEIEKAHVDIFNVLLQVMDYATLTDNTGKKADFRNIILIMTSNAGAREVGRRMIGFEERKEDKGAIQKAVDKIFSPEFRNRLDEIIVFNSMNLDMAQLIAKKEINKFKQKLEEKNIELLVTDHLIQWLAKKGVESDFGAREILRLVQDEIKSYFVEQVLFGKLSKGGKATVDFKDGKVQIQAERKQ
jgi:ATP-dependent Clp protease ATP-binding subunit ClpA